MKKLLATLLSILMITSVLPVGVIGITASAEESDVTSSEQVVSDVTLPEEVESDVTSSEDTTSDVTSSDDTSSDATSSEDVSSDVICEHVYDNDCDTTCNECGDVRDTTHKYDKVTTVKATTSKNGYVLTECSVCGKDKSKTKIYYAKSFKLSATSYAYDKKEKTPSVTVKDAAGKTLKKDTDYTVKYSSGRKNVGTYKVAIKLQGKYSGSKTLTFTIKPTTKTSATLLIGVSKSIGANSNKTITYSSSKKSVATVNSKGVVTAKKAGTATISVKSNGVTQKIKVTVKTPYVKISGTSSMWINKSVTLKTTSNTSAKVTWSSSNKSIATVSSSGRVTGKKAGSATIYAKITYKGRTYTGKYTVKVKKPYVKLSKTDITIYVGEPYKLTATATPTATVKFKSSNTKVATVSSSGKITPKDKGSATITAYFTYAGKTYSKTCSVTVKKSTYRLVKNYIIKNGAKDADGNRTIGEWIEEDGTTCDFTITYNVKKDCLVFYMSIEDVELQSRVKFELKENQKTAKVKMIIDAGELYGTANVRYDLTVAKYNIESEFAYYITTTGGLSSEEFEPMVSLMNLLSFSGWEMVLSENGYTLKDVGFKNLY